MTKYVKKYTALVSGHVSDSWQNLILAP